MNITNVVLFFQLRHFAKNISIAHESNIRLSGIEMIILGSILIPFVSSSKNLRRPALDAGNGALFFFLLSANTFLRLKFWNKNFVLFLHFF